MAINFPDNPTNGQVALVGGKNYTYNSTKNTWTPTQVTEADLSTVGSTTVVATHDLLPASPSAGDMALVSSVNKMYVYFLSGWWLMSSLQNASPSGITGNAAIYDLAADGTPTTVTLSSSDPEGFPIVWSHSVISGSLGGTTVTNVNNVFTITPSTDAADAGTFTLRFAASDGQGGESGSQSQFTLDFVFTVTNSRYTTLLATAVDTSDNNNITDASTNNHSITVNGDAHAGTFSPYRSGGYSTSFDGSNDYLITPSSDFHLSTGQFSVEVWIKPSDLSGNKLIFMDTNYNLWTYNTQVKWWDGSTYVGNAGVDLLSVGKWTHLLVTRDSNNTLRIFADGILLHATTNHTHNYGTSNTAFEISYSGGNKFAGEMRDARVISGSIPSDYQTSSTTTTDPSAVITVPTEPLTAVSGTKLLACNQPYLGYTTASATGYFNTIGGDPSTKPFSPYDYEEYDTVNHGGSVYFDGSGDTLEIPHSTNVGAFGTNDFTVQLWYYTDATNSQDYLIDFRQYGANGDYLSIYKNGSNKIVVAEGGSNRITGTKNIDIGQWFFITVHRDSGSLKLFVNGEQDGSTYSDSTNYVAGGSGNFIIGKNNGGANYLMEGYLSDIKVTHGSALDGTTVPTAPLSSSGTSLHIKGTDASIIDKSQSSNLKLLGNTTGSTTQVKFADTKSMYFDGSGDRATATGVPDLGDDFTIECWLYSTTTGNRGIVSSIDNVGNWGGNGYWSFGIYGGGTYPQLQIDDSSYSGASTSLPTNQWVHLATTRTSNTVRYFINGTLDSTTFSNSLTLKNPSGIVIGSSPNNNYIYNYTGYIQDLRITNECKYTANFTPPTASLEG